MPKFRELEARPVGHQMHPDLPVLIAKRYHIQEKLARGSFGTVYLVRDTQAADGECFKVLKEVLVGDLKPDETAQALTEAELLAELHHPSILKFYSSFLEKDVFCIITEYCEDGDLDCKLDEFRQVGLTLPESQVAEWLIQLLLGVHYMHQRKILHRDLKAKNIFLKKNIVKIGDFGVSRLLNGTCDLATTFTGTPYYMSPEVLSHQSYNSKSDIWSLGCVLYEMCSLERAFGGHSFLSLVMKIMECPAPSLPEAYSKELGSILQLMLSKDPEARPSAAELLKMTFMEENMQTIKLKFRGKTQKCERHGEAVQKVVHLEMLRGHSEVQKMTPRERMRMRKLQAADEEACKLKNVMGHWVPRSHSKMAGRRDKMWWMNKIQKDPVFHIRKGTSRFIVTMQKHMAFFTRRLTQYRKIPEDPQTAEAYYNEDGFESWSEEDGEVDEALTIVQDSDLQAMVSYMKDILENPDTVYTEVKDRGCSGALVPAMLDCAMAETRMQRMKESIQRKLGATVFQRVYEYLKQARQQQESEVQVWAILGELVDQPSICFDVDQLLYYEEMLQNAREGHR